MAQGVEESGAAQDIHTANAGGVRLEVVQGDTGASRRSAGNGHHGQLSQLPGLAYYGIQVLEHFGDGHGVDLAPGVVALSDDLLEVAAGDLGG